MSEWPRRLSEIDWEEIAVRLAAYLSYRLGRRAGSADIEELVAETLCRVIDHEYKNWDPEVEPNPLRFCISVANGLVRNFVRRHYRRFEVPPAEHLSETVASPRAADKNVHKRDDRQAMAILRERLAGDQLANRVLDLYADGVEKTRHIAEELGVSRPEVHNAKRRIQSHFGAVRAALGEEVPDA